MKYKIKPLSNYVFVKPIEEETKTKSGIVLSENDSKKKTTRGIVVAIGQGKVLGNGAFIPVSLKEGDIVLFSTYTPEEIKLDNEKYLVLREDEILGVE